MKRILVILILVGMACVGISFIPPTYKQTARASYNKGLISTAYKTHLSGIQVSGEGMVTRILSDDNEGLRHQRFIITLANGQTLLIAHNIDIAPRVAGLEIGDTIAFYGEYAWNEKGGVIHWTHHDPHGHHAAGWLRKGAKTYQ